MLSLFDLAFRSLDLAHEKAPKPFRIGESEIKVPHSTMWLPHDRPILDATAHLIGLLSSYDPDAIAEHAPRNLDQEFMRKYLYMTNIRVVSLADLLQKRLPKGSTILEIGSFFGSFSLALQNLGYKVTAVDRYNEFKGRFDSHIAAMKEDGVEVILADRNTEAELIDRLPSYNAVIAMAVVEHIPHTPRGFLEMLKAKVRPGGLLALDTPNVARYWNRKRLNGGGTIFQDLEQQFYCTPPWEGHHREFTPAEMQWMMSEIGCRNVALRTLDYNMLQFEVIDRPHIECLEACINDPGMADVILVVGQTPD